MKGLFIINPSSGRQNFIDKIKEIAGMLVIDQICNTIDVFYTEKQDDALNKAAALEKGQYDFVVAVGGDGTLNEVINGVVLSQSNTPVAVISAGTVNDFATYLNLPQLITDYHDRHPLVTCHLDVEGSKTLFHMLKARDLHAIFIIGSEKQLRNQSV